jgi:uncharacterized protein (DUF1697 family)
MRWVALLRGINVGGNKKVAMADLRGLLEGLGYKEVTTVLQSGNAVFTATGAASKLETQIGARITADLGLDVKVLVRSAKELAAVVDANPWPARGADPKELHFAFLSAAAPATKIAAITADDFLPDEFEVGDRVLYLRLPAGMGKTRFPNWDRLLGVDVTARNWNTVNRLKTLAGG